MSADGRTFYRCPCGIRVSEHSMHFQTCDVVRAQAERFTEDEYRADPEGVVEFAIKYGRALVVREDGSVRVCISVPPPEEPK